MDQTNSTKVFFCAEGNEEYTELWYANLKTCKSDNTSKKKIKKIYVQVVDIVDQKR